MSDAVTPSPTPPGRQPPPAWFFIAVGLSVVVAVVILIARGHDSGTPPEAVPAWPSAVDAPETTAPAALPTTGPTTVVPTDPTMPLGSPSDLLGASCSYDREGYGIDYPAGWSVPSDPAWTCQLFDPQPIVVQPNTEVPMVAVTVYAEHYRMSKVFYALADPAFYQVISTEQGTFSDANRPGTILETKSTAGGYWPRGTRTYTVLVDRIDSTIGVTTNDLTGDYEQNKQIVLAMAQSLRISG